MYSFKIQNSMKSQKKKKNHKKSFESYCNEEISIIKSIMDSVTKKFFCVFITDCNFQIFRKKTFFFFIYYLI